MTISAQPRKIGKKLMLRLVQLPNTADLAAKIFYFCVNLHSKC